MGNQESQVEPANAKLQNGAANGHANIPSEDTGETVPSEAASNKLQQSGELPCLSTKEASPPSVNEVDGGRDITKGTPPAPKSDVLLSLSLSPSTDAPKEPSDPPVSIEVSVKEEASLQFLKSAPETPTESDSTPKEEEKVEKKGFFKNVFKKKNKNEIEDENKPTVVECDSPPEDQAPSIEAEVLTNGVHSEPSDPPVSIEVSVKEEASLQFLKSAPETPTESDSTPKEEEKVEKKGFFKNVFKKKNKNEIEDENKPTVVECDSPPEDQAPSIEAEVLTNGVHSEPSDPPVSIEVSVKEEASLQFLKSAPETPTESDSTPKEEEKVEKGGFFKNVFKKKNKNEIEDENKPTVMECDSPPEDQAPSIEAEVLTNGVHSEPSDPPVSIEVSVKEEASLQFLKSAPETPTESDSTPKEEEKVEKKGFFKNVFKKKNKNEIEDENKPTVVECDSPPEDQAPSIEAEVLTNGVHSEPSDPPVSIEVSVKEEASLQFLKSAPETPTESDSTPKEEEKVEKGGFFKNVFKKKNKNEIEDENKPTVMECDSPPEDQAPSIEAEVLTNGVHSEPSDPPVSIEVSVKEEASLQFLKSAPETPTESDSTPKEEEKVEKKGFFKNVFKKKNKNEIEDENKPTVVECDSPPEDQAPSIEAEVLTNGVHSEPSDPPVSIEVSVKEEASLQFLKSAPETPTESDSTPKEEEKVEKGGFFKNVFKKKNKNEIEDENKPTVVEFDSPPEDQAPSIEAEVLTNGIHSEPSDPPVSIEVSVKEEASLQFLKSAPETPTESDSTPKEEEKVEKNSFFKNVFKKKNKNEIEDENKPTVVECDSPPEDQAPSIEAEVLANGIHSEPSDPPVIEVSVKEEVSLQFLKSVPETPTESDSTPKEEEKVEKNSFFKNVFKKKNKNEIEDENKPTVVECDSPPEDQAPSIEAEVLANGVHSEPSDPPVSIEVSVKEEASLQFLKSVPETPTESDSTPKEEEKVEKGGFFKNVFKKKNKNEIEDENKPTVVECDSPPEDQEPSIEAEIVTNDVHSEPSDPPVSIDVSVEEEASLHLLNSVLETATVSDSTPKEEEKVGKRGFFKKVFKKKNKHGIENEPTVECNSPPDDQDPSIEAEVLTNGVHSEPCDVDGTTTVGTASEGQLPNGTPAGGEALKVSGETVHQVDTEEQDSGAEDSPVMNFFKTLVTPSKAPKDEGAPPAIPVEEVKVSEEPEPKTRGETSPVSPAASPSMAEPKAPATVKISVVSPFSKLFKSKQSSKGAQPETTTKEVDASMATKAPKPPPPPPPPEPPKLEVKVDLEAKALNSAQKEAPKDAVKEPEAASKQKPAKGSPFLKLFHPKEEEKQDEEPQPVEEEVTEMDSKAKAADVQITPGQSPKSEKKSGKSNLLFRLKPLSLQVPAVPVCSHSVPASSATATPDTKAKEATSVVVPTVTTVTTQAIVVEPRPAAEAEKMRIVRQEAAPADGKSVSGASQSGEDGTSSLTRKLEKRNSIHMFFKSLAPKRQSEAGVQTDPVTITYPAK
ncbi:breast carcinoma-amplified sequence 1 [Conger conger]|uniref:breast carcinoma-amplified sequence 1 n=1 Tax=Conger conger TaxID=82655 RepID=UPI002A5A48AC|nr:breast carcinoma-amplified sequence 1 [Conger conger]